MGLVAAVGAAGVNVGLLERKADSEVRVDLIVLHVPDVAEDGAHVWGVGKARALLVDGLAGYDDAAVVSAGWSAGCEEASTHRLVEHVVVAEGVGGGGCTFEQHVFEGACEYGGYVAVPPERKAVLTGLAAVLALAAAAPILAAIPVGRLWRRR